MKIWTTTKNKRFPWQSEQGETASMLHVLPRHSVFWFYSIFSLATYFLSAKERTVRSSKMSYMEIPFLSYSVFSKTLKKWTIPFQLENWWSKLRIESLLRMKSSLTKCFLFSLTDFRFSNTKTKHISTKLKHVPFLLRASMQWPHDGLVSICGFFSCEARKEAAKGWNPPRFFWPRSGQKNPLRSQILHESTFVSRILHD